MAVPSQHMAFTLSTASVDNTVTLEVVTISDVAQKPQCRCGQTLMLAQPSEDEDRLIGVCPEGCEWTIVEILPAPLSAA